MEPLNQTTPTMPPLSPITPAPVVPPPAPVTPPPAPEPLVPPVPPITPIMPPQQPEHKSFGPIVGVIIILILLVAAAIYVWGQKLNNDARTETVTPITQQQTQTAPVEPQGDEFTGLEASADASVEGLDDLNF